MKTIKEKAKEIVDDLPFAVACHRAHLERAIVSALMEQDRDTRHACAEAVSKLQSFGMTVVNIDAARNAVMNTKAVYPPPPPHGGYLTRRNKGGRR